MCKGGWHSPWKCCKVLSVLQMLSKVSADEVFIHYFEKILLASRALAPQTTRTLPLELLEDFRPSDPLTAHPGKNPAGAHEYGGIH